MVYDDIIQWFKSKNFIDREQAENYIKRNQGGILYSQQIDALDYYFEKKEEPFKYEQRFEEKRLSPLQQLQGQQVKRTAQPTTPIENIPAPVQEQQRQESRIRKLVRSLFGR